MKRTGKFLLKLTPKEKSEFEDLTQRLQDECDISEKRQSEIIFEGFKQYAEQLLASYIPNHTHTKPQSSQAARNQALSDMIAEIERLGHILLEKSYVDFLKMNDCLSEVKPRTQNSWYQRLITSEELWFLNVNYFSDTNHFSEIKKSGIYIIHQRSKWWPQLKNLCFKLDKPVLTLTDDRLPEHKVKERIFSGIKRKSHHKPTLDRAEKTMLNIFLHEIGVLEEKPIYDNTDLTMQEVIRLRSELRFEEARDLLEQEKQQKAVVETIDNSNDGGLEFLNAIQGGQTK